MRHQKSELTENDNIIENFAKFVLHIHLVTHTSKVDENSWLRLIRC